MNIPISYKPKVLQSDIDRGSIVRYFVKPISRHNIIEINGEQFNTFKNDPYYIAIQIPWIVKGFLFSTVVRNVQVLSLEEQNRKIVTFYSKRMPGLERKLKNMMELAIVTVNTPS
jgi:hypothetical protein